MKRNLLSVFTFLTALSLACNSVTSLTPFGPTPASGSRTDGFSAEATSPVSVKLTWPTGTGVEKYLIDVRIGEQDFIPVAELPADQTSFEDFPVPRNSELTYRLRTVTGSETSDGKMVTVTTPPATPNPITVQAKPYQPVAWTPPTVDPNNPNLDPKAFYPPGFDPNNPEAFDPSSVMTSPSASELIGPKGGRVTVTSPDGVVYTLEIPEGAVEDAIIIKLTPIESIADLPLDGGMLAAVKIEPEGFILDAPATLAISLPDGTPPVPAGKYDVGFAYQGEGSEFHLVPQVAPSEVSAVNSSEGLKLASLAQGTSRKSSGEIAVSIGVELINKGLARWPAKIVDIAKDHSPSSPGDQTSLDMAVIQVVDALAAVPPRTNKTFDPAMVEIAQSYLKRADASSNGAELMNVMDDFQRYLEAGNDIPAMDEINNKIWDKLLEKAKILLDKNPDKCFSADDPSAQELADRMWNPKTKFSSTLSQKFDLKYPDANLKQMAEELVKKCKVTLKIVSSISYQQDGITISAAVLAMIPLKWKFDRTAQRSFLSGSGALTYTLFDEYGLGCSKAKLNTKDGSVFTVSRLSPIYDGKKLSNFSLTEYTVTGNQQKVTAVCPGGQAIGRTAGGAQGDVWGGLFVVAHAPGNMIVDDWNKITKNENPSGIVAEKEYRWNGPTTLAGGSGNVDELTTFTLVVGKK